MGAPEGNQFWKLRSKHGRDKIFSSPEILWEECCKYFEATDSRKWTKKDWVGKDAFEVTRETETPYSKSGLCLFLDCDWRTIEALKDDSNKDFMHIITRIEQIIYTQKLEGASVGAFNPSIVARELGLTEKQDISNTNINIELSTEEKRRKIAELKEKLNKST